MCALMAEGTTFNNVAGIIYCGGGAFVRYLYVRSSLRKDIQASKSFHISNIVQMNDDIYFLISRKFTKETNLSFCASLSQR